MSEELHVEYSCHLMREWAKMCVKNGHLHVAQALYSASKAILKEGESSEEQYINFISHGDGVAVSKLPDDDGGTTDDIEIANAIQQGLVRKVTEADDQLKEALKQLTIDYGDDTADEHPDVRYLEMLRDDEAWVRDKFIIARQENNV
jgi:hypothetical protein